MQLRTQALIAGAALLGSFAGAAARADMVLSYQETGPGTITGAGTVNTPALPGSTFYGDTFSTPTTPITGTTDSFYDDFVFTIASGSVDSLTSTINLGCQGQGPGCVPLLNISDLQVRLYNLAGNAPPVVGVPVGGAIDAWSTQITYAPGMTGTTAVLPATQLSAGTYVLEVIGNATGSSGGSYSGVLNLTPVPLPETLPLFLSGLSVFGGLARLRRRR
jgi:hypothetical protein